VAIPGFAVQLEGVSVHYRLPHERILTFKEFAIQWMRGRVTYDDLMALSDVHLRITPGESIGIIGRNGAGKTTLMKVIARVLRPSEGTVHIRGKVAPLLELGAGFDMELSGRENVFLNGAILGRSRREMQRRFDWIVEFSELGHFIDAPLRTYSTGMVARLGFAVATDVEPDILLIDELLSVGDLEFQRKCTERIETILQRGATLILVSHSPESVLQLCSRVVWLEQGRVVADGPAPDVVEAFVKRAVPSPVRSAG
jgi:ABC-2 type transport system ATP-binding protein/lipopolysaccharide transport system ATP-binding protein